MEVEGCPTKTAISPRIAKMEKCEATEGTEGELNFHERCTDAREIKIWRNQRSMGRAKTAIIHRLSPKMSIVHPWMICFDLPMPHEVFDLLNKEILGLTRFGIDTPGFC